MARFPFTNAVGGALAFKTMPSWPQRQASDSHQRRPPTRLVRVRGGVFFTLREKLWKARLESAVEGVPMYYTKDHLAT